jgi:hypothetical protein
MQTGNPTNSVWKRNETEIDAINLQAHNRHMYAPAVKHLHGHLGKMVFKERMGEDIVAEKPDQVNQPNSPAQMAQRQNFRDAAAYGKGAMADTHAHAAYAAKAKELHSSPMAVAIQDWMSPPIVSAIDLSQYNKHVGDVISITAQDDFEVTGVTVVIKDNAQAVVESGAAVFDAAGGSWKYTATVDASAKPSVTATATASDRPGNNGVLGATK